MKYKPLMIVSAVLALASLPAAQAIPIDGEISFSGSYAVNNSNLNSATAFTSFTSVTVANTSGDYGVFSDGTAATWLPFNFASFTPVDDMWTILAGPGASFDLESIQIDFQSSTALLLTGQGTAYLGGKDPTPGTWNLTANTLGTTFSFSSTSAASSVPDGGSSLVLLGMGATCLGLVRRIRKA